MYENDFVSHKFEMKSFEMKDTNATVKIKLRPHCYIYFIWYLKNQIFSAIFWLHFNNIKLLKECPTKVNKTATLKIWRAPTFHFFF